ncbi:ABC transporter ATP-binding protein [Aquidulcibacter sp.]|uniref:ABC transporter ATP-binding protein n=1 Tax=Aquidulcibacter sp. TaxID=2052990 RepID=UPI0025B8B43B|nr:ABC transporter ATP-binding protein [Aquidulcibacter sp.]MCA3693480.1 ABC transporter ATP-binding protein [Aquidulcibacter sp.]
MLAQPKAAVLVKLSSVIASAQMTANRVWTILMESGPWLTAAVIAATFLEAALSIGSLYAIKLLVDSIGRGLQGTDGHTEVFWYLGLTGTALILAAVAQSIANLLRMRQGFVVGDLVNSKIHDRAIALDLSFYESPQYFDSLQKAREAGAQRPAQVIGNVINGARGAIVLVAILVMLAAIEWRLLPILLLTVGAALGVRLLFTKRLYDWRMTRAQLERRSGYLDWMLTSNHHAKELRINGLGAYFADSYKALQTKIRKENLSLEQKRAVFELGVAAFGSIVFMGAAAFLIDAALMGSLTIGQVAMFVLLLRRAESAGNEMVSSVSRLVDDHLYLGRLFEFFDTKPKITTAAQPAAIALPLTAGIQMENVSFRYEGAERASVSDINFEMRPGQIVALVGENGSGKTTLIKLLNRLYDPTEGRILLDGTDIRHLEPDAYRALFSVIFQDYSCYADTITNNIRFGNVALPHNADVIRRAAEVAGADRFIDALPAAYQTPLTKLFDDGHDLSIGQWQRIALARSLFPESQFVIMDEPTSAVDPAAEFELFENFRERLGQRGALIISHRLSTVRQADFTYVLEDGRIKEAGTHDELIALNGSYARLFNMQAKHYL